MIVRLLMTCLIIQCLASVSESYMVVARIRSFHLVTEELKFIFVYTTSSGDYFDVVFEMFLV